MTTRWAYKYADLTLLFITNFTNKIHIFLVGKIELVTLQSENSRINADSVIATKRKCFWGSGCE
jgi:hypothetical protein